MEKPKVKLIIISWNGKKLLKENLPYIKSTKYKNKEIIVIDNGSEDGTVDFLKREHPSVKIVRFEENKDWSKAHNFILKEILDETDFICFLNNDVKPTSKNWLNELINFLENTKYDITGPLFLGENGKDLDPYMKYHKEMFKDFERNNLKQKYEEKYILAACMLVSVNVFKEVGIFDPMIPFFHSELDFCRRARNNDFKISYNTNVKFLHKHQGTINCEDKNIDYSYQKIRDYVYYILKNPTQKFSTNLKDLKTHIKNKLFSKKNTSNNKFLLLISIIRNFALLPLILNKRHCEIHSERCYL